MGHNHTAKNVAMLLGGVAAGVLGSKLIPALSGMMAGSARVRAGGDPFGQLIQDHRQIESLLDEMSAVSAGEKFRRSRLFLALKRKLAKHAMAEEDVVYPIVHQNAGQTGQSKHLYDEHAEMKIRLFELEERLKSGAEWRDEVASLTQIVRSHVEEEERDVFPKLRRQLADAKLPSVSGQISREEAMVV